MNDEARKAKIEKIVQGISHHAVELFDLIQPGMSIEVNIAKPDLIVMPGAVSKMNKLIITRPVSFLKVNTLTKPA